MLTLRRNKDEAIIINGDIRIVYLGKKYGQFRFGIEAPKEVNIITKISKEESDKRATNVIKPTKKTPQTKPVSTLPDGAYLGHLCKRKHDYRNTGKSMMLGSGSCIVCMQEKSKGIEERLLAKKKEM